MNLSIGSGRCLGGRWFSFDYYRCFRENGTFRCLFSQSVKRPNWNYGLDSIDIDSACDRDWWAAGQLLCRKKPCLLAFKWIYIFVWLGNQSNTKKHIAEHIDTIIIFCCFCMVTSNMVQAASNANFQFIVVSHQEREAESERQQKNLYVNYVVFDAAHKGIVSMALAAYSYITLTTPYSWQSHTHNNEEICILIYYYIANTKNADVGSICATTVKHTQYTLPSIAFDVAKTNGSPDCTQVFAVCRSFSVSFFLFFLFCLWLPIGIKTTPGDGTTSISVGIVVST